MGKKDSPDKSTEKADLETIIKRRKRTVAQYLAEKEIKTEKQLKGFLKRLRTEFTLSSSFLKACDKCFPKTVTKPLVTTTTEQDASITIPVKKATPKKTVSSKGKTKKSSS